MSEPIQHYNLSHFTPAQLDDLATQVEAMKPYDDLIYKFMSFLGRNLLLLWTFCILMLFDLETWILASACAVAFAISQLISKSNNYDHKTIRAIIQYFADIENESKQDRKKRQWKYTWAMLSWICALYLPMIAVIYLERSGEIAVDVSRWLQVAICLSWVALYMKFSPDKHLMNTLEQSIKNARLSYRAKKRGKLYITWLCSTIALSVFLSVFAGSHMFGAFGFEPYARAFEDEKYPEPVLRIVMALFIFMFTAWIPSLYLSFTAKVSLIALPIKKVLDNSNK